MRYPDHSDIIITLLSLITISGVHCISMKPAPTASVCSLAYTSRSSSLYLPSVGIPAQNHGGQHDPTKIFHPKPQSTSATAHFSNMRLILFGTLFYLKE